MQSATPRELLPLVWPLSLSLATTQEISVDFSSSPYLDVSVQAVPLIYLFDSVYDAQSLHCADFSIRTSADQSVLTAPRSLSQLITSFFGSQCQGIHPALMFALPFAFQELLPADSHSAIIMQMFSGLFLNRGYFVVLPDFKFLPFGFLLMS